MRRTFTFLLVAAALLSCRTAHAQTPENWSASIGCALPADTARLRLTLPIGVLNELDRMSSSVFVHAFLIRYISDPEAGKHRLSQCARNFAGAGLTDFARLRQNLPDAAAIIDALRTAELARLRTVQLADSARTLPTVVARLRADSSQATLEGQGEQLAAARKFCPTGSTGACATLEAAVGQVDSLRRARSAADAAAARARQQAEEAQRAAEEYDAAAARLAADSLKLIQLEAAQIAADTAAIRELHATIAEWTEVARVRLSLRDSLRVSASAADSVRQQEAKAAQAAQAQLHATLEQLDAELRKAGESKLAKQTIEEIQSSRIGAAVEAIAPPPPAQPASANPTARSANLLLELTDFIIVRMRREAVNSFIVNLHAFAQSEPLLRYGFPETWGLMGGLSTRSDGRLNAVDVGRIPLSTWRATLAGDFVELPVNLLEAGHVALCRGGEAAVNARVRQQALLGRESCRQRVAMLTPLVPVATRLLQGDAVFDVLRDAGSFALPQGPDFPPEWRYLSQGLTVLATLAETHLVQGFSPAADPRRHPYVLTSQSLVQVPQQQRDAFLRLLLVRAVPSAVDVPASIDTAALGNAAAGATRLLERLASRPDTARSRPADAGLVVRGAFEALLGAADVARVLAPREAAVWLDPLRTRWRVVSGAIESIVARDFGLALSRTTVLLRDVRGVEVPGAVLTFTALASSLSEAQDGAQVRAAFEAAASPVGGWQAKRYGEGGGSITAFPGVAAGYEQIIREKGDPEDADETATSFGASLPIGLEWQLKLSGAGGTSAPDCVLLVCGVGVFLPLIDLGALLSYRVNGPESVESEPNASFRQVFAPGAYLSLALTRSAPVNLLVGGQLMPSLRSISVDGSEETVSRSAIRYGIGIGMDILLLKF